MEADEKVLEAEADQLLRQAEALGVEDSKAYLASVADERPLVFMKLLERLPEVAAVLGINQAGHA